MAPLDHSPFLDLPLRPLEHVAAMRAVVIPDSSPYAFPQRQRAPRGTHVCGHQASIVWFLTWARVQPRSWTRDDLGQNEDAKFALDACVLNRYVACPSGLPIPVHYGHPSVRFVVSAAGRELLARARAAEQGRAAA